MKGGIFNSGVAKSIPFDTTDNNFGSPSVQEAIIEAKNKAISVSRFTITGIFNGTIGNNNWLGYSEVLPGNQVPIRLPINCKLREISFSYYTSTLLGVPLSGDQVTGKFKIFKNGLTDPTHVIHTEQFTNQVGGKTVSGLDLSLNANDFIVGKWIDEGNNPSDMAIVYFFEVIENG
jgi:hypothetical protein